MFRIFRLFRILKKTSYKECVYNEAGRPRSSPSPLRGICCRLAPSQPSGSRLPTFL
ncbi:MAG: hypothetical protein LBQ66_10195 [Planctomycetaceae bacterium]|nr:hypothetical protein [Planctomycetaceae bacterium]